MDLRSEIFHYKGRYMQHPQALPRSVAFDPDTVARMQLGYRVWQQVSEPVKGVVVIAVDQEAMPRGNTE